MKKFLSVLLMLFVLIPAARAVEDEWYPFVIPENLDQNSPADIGKFVLDAPAGKHGFVKVKDGHFFFEDGTSAKFWGTNLVFNACFPEKKQAKIIADRLAFFGFNAVRLHHMDFYFEPRGIFEDIAPAYKDPQMKKTGVLSKTQLDKLDYLIYQLKLRGIYIDMNLLVSRHFTEADGVKDGEALVMAAKPVSMFDSTLIGLQKQYAKDLLTHLNPYTKLHYNEEPAIALVEITNENSVVRYWQDNNLNGAFLGIRKKSISDHYVEALDKRWNHWLKEKYGSTENVEKAWAGDPVSPEQNANFAFDVSKWAIEQHNNAAAVKNVSNEEITIDVKNITDTPWHLQYRYTNLNLNKNKFYILRFTAKAAKNVKIGLVCQQASSPYNNLGLSETVELNENFQAFEMPFTANSDCINAKLAFIIGYLQSIITIKDISFKEQGNIIIAADEINSGFNFKRPIHKLRMLYSSKRIENMQSFYDDLEKKYFTEMTDFLRKDLNVKVPVTGSQYSDATVQESCDFIDKHAYWDHPRFPNKPWDQNDFKIHNKSMLLDKELGIVGSLQTRAPRLSSVVSRPSLPYTVTEWNYCYPNQYAYEGPMLMASKAVENNWDGMFQFAFSHGWKTEPVFDDIHDFFNIISNPQQLILNSIGSVVFHKAKDLTTTTENGILTLRSDIVQGAAGFIKDKTFIFDGFTITAGENGAVFIYSADGKPIKESEKLIIVAVSEIKNTNSGWNENEKFSWGTPPVLLKAMDVKINLLSDKNTKIYKLNEKGVRQEEIGIISKNRPFALSTKKSNSPWYEITR